MTPARPIRAVIVSASPVLRAGLAAMLEHRIAIAGFADHIHQPLPPADVILLDCNGGLHGDEIDSAGAPILALTDDLQSPFVRENLRAGARGIAPRDLSADELITALEAVAAGWLVLPPELREAILSGAPAQSNPQDDPLTAREIEVLRFLAEGSSNKTIAYKLDISEHTVKFHVNSILSKMRAQSRTEAVMLGLRRGWIPL